MDCLDIFLEPEFTDSVCELRLFYWDAVDISRKEPKGQGSKEPVIGVLIPNIGG